MISILDPLKDKQNNIVRVLTNIEETNDEVIELISHPNETE